MVSEQTRMAEFSNREIEVKYGDNGDKDVAKNRYSDWVCINSM